MRKKISLVKDDPQMRRRNGYFGISAVAIYVMFLAAFIAGCSKDAVESNQSAAVSMNSATISETYPADQADTVAINPVVAVTFKSAALPSEVSASLITLMNGDTPVAGTLTFSGNTATFTPTADLAADSWFTATIKTNQTKSVDGKKGDSKEHSWTFRTGHKRRAKVPSVVSVLPLNSATAVATTVQPSVTFSEEMESSTVNSTTFTIKHGTTAVAGTVTSDDKNATFKPSVALVANTVYTGTITTGVKDESGHSMLSDYAWSFTTGGGGVDVAAPTISSVVPANNASAIAVTSKPTVVFSEVMDPLTITAATVTLQQGTTVVAGTVSYSGNTATFTPAAALTANLVYTGTVTTGAKDVAGNAIAASYTWSFTTVVVPVADVTPPTVLSVLPASDATSVAVSATATATFSEAMNSSTITSSTFTVKQGTTTVAGTVTYSGTTATFTPSPALTGGVVYTATLSTGAKDAAGNAIASSYSWSFTTVATVAVISYATQVSPIITAKCMPCHGATSPSAGISLTNYAQVSALTTAQLDNAGMYSKMGVTTPEQTTIKAWIAAGKLNN